MTVQQYLDKMERQLENTLTPNLQKYIPAILERVGEVSIKKFIDEGDPVLDIMEFKLIFDKIITEAINRLTTKKDDDKLFQTITIKDIEKKDMIFRVGLN